MRFDDMQKLMATLEARLGKAWWNVVEHLRDQNQLGDVEARLAVGDVDGAIVGIEDAASMFAADVGAAYTTAGQTAAKWLDDKVAESLIRFDVTNDRAVQAIQQSTMQLRGGITSETKDVLRRVIGDGLAEGTNPREIARDVRSSIGLTDWQAQQVQSYRRLLESGDAPSLRAATDRQLSDGRHDRSLQRMARDGVRPTAAQIDAMTERYRQNWVAYRAETIARTEGLRAAHQGTEELYRQAIANGDIDAGSLTREWNTAHDRRVRSSHRAMNGQKRQIGEAFETGDGASLRYPGDPAAPIEETIQCRCALSTRFVAPAEPLATGRTPPTVATPGESVAPTRPLAPAPAPAPAEPDFSVRPVAQADAETFLNDIADQPMAVAEQRAVLQYQGGAFSDINEFARTGKIDAGSSLDSTTAAGRLLRDLDAAIASGSVPSDALLYRGIKQGTREGITGKIEVGSVIRDRGYTSTSISEQIAREFGSILLEIETPEGTHAVYIPADGSLAEAEVLLGRDTQLEVLSIREDNGKTVARVRVVT